MNELNISIKNPYNGEETAPIFDSDAEREFYYTKSLGCPVPVNLHICRCKDESAKLGYKWLTYPCQCYPIFDNEEFKAYTDDINVALANYEKNVKVLNNNLIHKDFSLCKNCHLYKQHIENKAKFPPAHFVLMQYGYYGKLLYQSYKNNELNEEIKKYPYGINLSLDSACNLRCPTCRTNDYHLPDISEEDLNILYEYVKNIRSLSIGCDGEFFLSKAYTDFLKRDLSNSKLEEIILYTNGTLCNKTNWEKINTKNVDLIKEIKISIDAACEETYKKVRSQTLWNTLLNNIKNLHNMISPNCMLTSTFTISSYNYKDIVDFTQFAKNLGFKRITYSFARTNLHGEGDSGYIIKDQDTINQIVEIIKMQQSKYNDYDNDTFYVNLS